MGENRVVQTSTLFLVMDLTGVFAFALNGALTALRFTRLDLVGVITLAMLTALGGGIIRDTMLDALPPATFVDWRYLAVAASGGLVVFCFGHLLGPLSRPIDVLDAAGLSLFAVAGALKALEHGMGPAQAAILGAVTGVGGGTLRDVLIREVPAVLTSGLYAIPALVAATTVVVGEALGATAVPAAVAGALACFTIRLVGLHYDVHAPMPRGRRPG